MARVKTGKILDAIAATPSEVAMISRVALAFSATWQTIAGDIFNVVNEQRGNRNKVLVLSRAEVFDACIDYLDMYGRDKEAVEWFLAQKFHSSAMMKKVLPFAKYG